MEGISKTTIAGFGALGIITVALFGLLLTSLGSGSTDEKAEKLTTEDQIEILNKNLRHVKGNPENAKVVLIEFSDFECPGCKSMAPEIAKIAAEYPDEVAVYYRHFPLSFHLNSKEAAYASEAAANQGKFWEMHDLIFDKQSTWKDYRGDALDEEFVKYADQLELNTEKFSKDYESDDLRELVQIDLDDAATLKLGGTPSIFLNDEAIATSEFSYEQLKIRIDSILADTE